jgi:hypothetical protein
MHEDQSSVVKMSRAGAGARMKRKTGPLFNSNDRTIPAEKENK